MIFDSRSPAASTRFKAGAITRITVSTCSRRWRWSGDRATSAASLVEEELGQRRLRDFGRDLLRCVQVAPPHGEIVDRDDAGQVALGGPRRGAGGGGGPPRPPPPH